MSPWRGTARKLLRSRTEVPSPPGRERRLRLRMERHLPAPSSRRPRPQNHAGPTDPPVLARGTRPTGGQGSVPPGARLGTIQAGEDACPILQLPIFPGGTGFRQPSTPQRGERGTPPQRGGEVWGQPGGVCWGGGRRFCTPSGGDRRHLHPGASSTRPSTSGDGSPSRRGASARGRERADGPRGGFLPKSSLSAPGSAAAVPFLPPPAGTALRRGVRGTPKPPPTPYEIGERRPSATAASFCSIYYAKHKATQARKV